MTMLPPAASVSRNSAMLSEDLPAPVLPTIPICKDTPFLKYYKYVTILELKQTF